MRTQLFTQIGLDSGALGALGSVVHRFDEEGSYLATVIVDGREEAEFGLHVVEDGPQGRQVDLATAGKASDPCDPCGDDDVTVGVGGWLSFYVGSGGHRYAVLVRRSGKRGAEFDSRRLQHGDLFAATVLRPGTYRVTNEYGKGSSELVVRYVRPGKGRYQPARPVKIKVGESLAKDSLKVGPAQGLIFEAQCEARIVVELVEPDDGD